MILGLADLRNQILRRLGNVDFTRFHLPNWPPLEVRPSPSRSVRTPDTKLVTGKNEEATREIATRAERVTVGIGIHDISHFPANGVRTGLDQPKDAGR